MENYKINWHESSTEIFGSLVSLFIWSGIAILGFIYLPDGIENENFQSLIIIIWALVCMNLTKLVHAPNFIINEVKK